MPVCPRVVAVVLLLGGCATPSERMDRTAAELGFSVQPIQGEGFRLLAYRNRSERPDGRLHVYLEGDGTPWLTRTRIAPDPTPRNPLALRLMALDPAPSQYLTRPCYKGAAADPGCHPGLWTSGRYSEPVVAAMAAALRRLIADLGVHQVVLIGYSGGGVLAWQLAQRIEEVSVLVTIAANLDIDRWTDLHGYSRLTDSLNPAAGPPMRPGVAQWHFLGRDDTNVPPNMIDPFERQTGPRARVSIQASDHHCCWLELWPGILRRLPM